MKPAILVAVVLILLILLTSCAPGPNDYKGSPRNEEGRAAGFWLGLWHGVIAPITFVISLFNPNVNVYEVHNNGGWYNLGFLFGFGAFWGGGSHSASSARRRRL